MFSIVLYVLISVTPGAWLSFLPRLGNISLLWRCVFAYVMSPVVLFMQYYLFQLLALSFEQTIGGIAVVNLPVLYFVYRRARDANSEQLVLRAEFKWHILVYSIPLVFLLVKFHYPQLQAYTSHAWMHCDTMYMFANGMSVPEEAELAGIAHAYPWVGHLYQSILSRVLDSPPVASYHITNILWLLSVLVFMSGIVRLLGGSKFAQRTSAIWLCFGVNCVGSVCTVKPLRYILEFLNIDHFPIWGDIRYDVWMEKFFFLNYTVCGVAIYSAALCVALSFQDKKHRDRSLLYLLGILCCCMGLVYPILLPTVLSIIGALCVTTILDQQQRRPDKIRTIVVLVVAALVACCITFIHIEVLSQNRVTSAHAFSTPGEFVIKLIRSMIALSPLLLGAVLTVPNCWRRYRAQTTVLIVSAGVSILLNCLLSLVMEDEYKFIHTAAISLAPFPAIAFWRVLQCAPRWTNPAFIIVAVLLVGPFIHRMYDKWPYISDKHSFRPALDLSHFDLRLDDSDPMSKSYDAIRESTAPDTILIVHESDLHIPTLTQRSLYVAPYREISRPGVNISDEFRLTKLKGISSSIIKSRRSTVERIFTSTNKEQLELEMKSVFALKRAVAILIHNNVSLKGNLMSWQRGYELYDDGMNSVWYIDDVTNSEAKTTKASVD